MQVQLSFVVLLFLMCSGLCSDAGLGKEAMEEEMLSSLFTSEVQESRHNTPLWQLPVLNLCRMLERVSEPRQDDWQIDGIPADDSQIISSAMNQNLYELLILCRVLHPRQQSQEYFEEDQNSESPLKRKSPYILKRQLHTKKPRRPYILKRG
ncbi:neurotensin/neuromedin N [Trichomycterus rosablanca]|uniref:neurotensin/neuromedin N n=1 Tax=Trichomycterus rosablanca TaxID=2290929 RepID=UPI002F35B619